MQNDSSMTEILSSYIGMKAAAQNRTLINRDRILDALKQLDIKRIQQNAKRAGKFSRKNINTENH